jgi:hypothetical protein
MPANLLSDLTSFFLLLPGHCAQNSMQVKDLAREIKISSDKLILPYRAEKICDDIRAWVVSNLILGTEQAGQWGEL